MKNIFRILFMAAVIIASTLELSSCSKEQDVTPNLRETNVSNVNEPRTIIGYAQIQYNTRARYSYVDNNSATVYTHHWEWRINTDGVISNLTLTLIGSTNTGGTIACYIDAGPAYEGPQGTELVLYDNGVPVASKPIQSSDASLNTL